MSSEPAAKKSRAKEEDVVHPLGGLENLSQSLWLVKIPQYICEQWAQAQQDQLLGTFHVGKASADGKRQFVVKLSDDINTNTDNHNHNNNNNENNTHTHTHTHTHRNGSAKLPRDLVVAEIPRPKGAGPETIVAFSSDEKRRVFSVEGRVSKRFVMRPQHQSEFAAVMRERALAERARKQTVEIKEVDEEERAKNLGKTIDLSLQETRQAVRKQSAQGAGSREEQIRKKVFAAFEQSDHLSFQELLRHCQQIEGFSSRDELKSVLNEYAFFNRQGQHRNLYELKSEYRLNAE